MPDLVLRPAKAGDAKSIAEMEKICFTVPWSYEAILAELTENPRAFYLIAESCGEIIGYAGVWIILDEGHITNVAVLPEHRGRKTGTAIVKQLLQITEARGVIRHTLEVRRSNRSAIVLYENLGFQTAGVRKGYYMDNGEDALIMWRHSQ